MVTGLHKDEAAHPCTRKNVPPSKALTFLHEKYPGADDESLESCCERLMSAKRSIYYLNARSYKMAFQLRAIYARDETMFFCLGLNNHSHINYSVDSIRFYIADEKRPHAPWPTPSRSGSP